MIIESFNYLPLEAKNIRETVFVNEQGFNYEFDDIDDIATHLVLYTDDKAAATCRFFIDKVKDTLLNRQDSSIKKLQRSWSWFTAAAKS